MVVALLLDYTQHLACLGTQIINVWKITASGHKLFLAALLVKGGVKKDPHIMHQYKDMRPNTGVFAF